MSAPRPTILVLLGCFWPGNDSSGPNQSFKALATARGDEFDFRLVARDRPTGAPSEGANTQTWVDLGFARARYRQIGRLGAKNLRELINQTPHDALWLNSMFDREFSLPALALRRLGLIARKPTLLSPRGEFGAGALDIKAGRKRLFFDIARRADLWRGVTLHATSEIEAADMTKGAAGANQIVVAPNIRLPPDQTPFVASADGALRLAFVGRIVPVKQLDYALGVLGGVKARVNFEIFGPAEDEGYWRRCQEIIARLPPHVRARWHGETSNDGIIARLAETDLFFLPTAGENFGHAIFEALASGVPVLISDQTPWRDLEQSRAGWDLPLATPERFAAAIETLAATPEAARAEWRRGARDAARRWIENSGAIARNVAMLRAMIGAER
jgi:glycosyltransferase involved in cell wall biosynthesis